MAAAYSRNSPERRRRSTHSGLLSLTLSIVFLFILPESPRFLLRRPQGRGRLVKTLARMGYHYESRAHLIDGAEAKGKTPAAALFGVEIRADTFTLWCAFFFALFVAGGLGSTWM